MYETLLRFVATPEDEGKTIRDVLQKKYGVSRRLLVRAKHQGMITRNGRSTFVTETLETGDEVAVLVPVNEEESVAPEAMPLDIRFEDEDFLVIAKPPGLVVHPTRNYESGTLANGMAAYWLAKGEKRKFRPVNRLDKDTSGLLIVAQNQWAHEAFSRLHREGSLQKTYQAFVHGALYPNEGLVDAPIAMKETSIIEREVRADGQAARTRYRVLARGELASRVELLLETGRTHQIRVHMSYLGHPLLGDDLYDGSREWINRQALHAWKLTFPHPRTGELMSFEEPLPEDMERLLPLFSQPV